MVSPSQAVHRPFGVTTYGSTIIRVEPDIASVHFAISRTAKHPKESFQIVREASRKLTDYLQSANFKKETSSARISLSQEWEYKASSRQFVGYTARAGFHTLLFDLDHLEELLIGIVDAGVNEIDGVSFQTSRLKELRAEARRKAVEAATAKAENYCLAAGVRLGSVIHIEDVNPDMADFFGRRYEGHAASQNVANMLEPGDGESLQAFNPGAIAITAAVLLSFGIANE
jgi:uncharacterized protein YggE